MTKHRRATVLLNGLLVLGLLSVPTLAFAQGPDQKAAEPEPKPTVPVFRLAGSLKEAPTDDLGLFGAASSGTLRETVARLDKAARDPAVKAVVVLVEPTAAVGRAQVEELRQAFERVKAAGKDVLAHADTLSMGQYVLASGASRLSASPTADIEVVGLYGEGLYLRGLLDKLGVQPDFLTCGDYKSAAEIFMRHAPSAEADSMQNWLIDSIYESCVRLIAEGRKATPETVKSWIDGGPYSAERALKTGLIDAVEHRQDLESRLKAKHGDHVVFDRKYGRKSSTKPDFSSPFGLMKFWAELLGQGQAKPAARKPGVAIVYVEGPIVVGPEQASLFAERSAASSPLRQALDQVAHDDDVKAVVLRVNSPGGSAIASEIILDATRRVKAKKPFAVSMGDVAGSGGYYVACAADTIFADASTITASIGVVSGKLATAGLFDKLGIGFKPYQRGQNAAMLASARPFNATERDAMRRFMDEIYEVFKGHVTASRAPRLKKPIDELAGGRVFTGKQALELGLVDRIGTLHDAIAFVAAEARLGDDYEVRVVPKPKNLIELLLDEADDANEAGKGLLRSAARPVIVELALPLLQSLDPRRGELVRRALGRLELIRDEGAVVMMPELSLGQ